MRKDRNKLFGKNAGFSKRKNPYDNMIEDNRDELYYENSLSSPVRKRTINIHGRHHEYDEDDVTVKQYSQPRKYIKHLRRSEDHYENHYEDDDYSDHSGYHDNYENHEFDSPKHHIKSLRKEKENIKNHLNSLDTKLSYLEDYYYVKEKTHPTSKLKTHHEFDDYWDQHIRNKRKKVQD